MAHDKLSCILYIYIYKLYEERDGKVRVYQSVAGV